MLYIITHLLIKEQISKTDNCTALLYSMIIIGFHLRNIPCPFIIGCTICLDCSGNSNVDITTIFNAHTHNISVPTLVVIPIEAFAPQLQPTIIYNLLEQIVTGLRARVIGVSSTGLV